MAPYFDIRSPSPPPIVKPATPTGRAPAHDRRQANTLGRRVHVPCERPGRGPRDAPPGVDVHGVHTGEIDHHPAVADAKPRPTVAAAAHGDWQVQSLDEGEHPRDVRRAGAAHDQRRMSVERTVEDLACGVVDRCVWRDDLPGDFRGEPADRRTVNGNHAIGGDRRSRQVAGRPDPAGAERHRGGCGSLHELSACCERHAA